LFALVCHFVSLVTFGCTRQAWRKTNSFGQANQFVRELQLGRWVFTLVQGQNGQLDGPMAATTSLMANGRELDRLDDWS